MVPRGQALLTVIMTSSTKMWITLSEIKLCNYWIDCHKNNHIHIPPKIVKALVVP